MNNPARLTIGFLFLFFSCTGRKAAPDPIPVDTTANNKFQVGDTSDEDLSADLLSPIPDSIKLLVVDDYPITYEMFGADTNQSGREIEFGGIMSLDKVWFSNGRLQQTIVVELYTDGFRNTEFHFRNDDIPKSLIDQMEFHQDGELVPLLLKEKHFNSFIKAARNLDAKYFKTNKGFKLGDSRQKAIDAYGKPDKITREGHIAILEWDFIGDNIYKAGTDLKGKPLAKDNYGHQVHFFFRGDKLIAMILHNDIP